MIGERFDTVICGHSHVPGIVETPRGRYVNTGTWASGQRTYGRWTGTRAQVLDADTGAEIGDEDYRAIPTQTAAQDLFDRWARR